MDFSLAALKLFCSQLKNTRHAPSQNASNFGGILFQRAWLQGILVSESVKDNGRMILDDGTGIIELSLSNDFLLRPWSVGMYVMVVGAYIVQTDEPPIISINPEGLDLSFVLSLLIIVKTLTPTCIVDLPIKPHKVHKIVDLSRFPDREAMWYLEVMEAYKMFYKPLVDEFS